MRSPRAFAAVAAPATAALATVVLSTGCGGPAMVELTFHATEAAKITTIQIAEGSGDVLVRTSARGDTAIQRVVRYRGDQPGATYRVEGDTLHVDTNCGNNCSVSYVIQAPAGVVVRGETGSGDINLTDVATADVTAGSGDITVRRASGTVTARTTSGDVEISDVRGAATLAAQSGDVRALGVGAQVDVDVTSGSVQVALTAAAPVKARTTSGDITLDVPPASTFTITAHTNGGDKNLAVENTPAAAHLLDLQATSGDITVRHG